MTIPAGLDHLQMIALNCAKTQTESQQENKGIRGDLTIIGTALSVLYQAATCHRQCHGGAHIFEFLCGRVYNLGTAAYVLLTCGFYDEAMNLTRSIGEVANLIGLSVVDKDALQEWLKSDKKTRLAKFSPGKIRAALKKPAPSLLIADDGWYARFCEEYTHVTPETKPGVHNDSGQRHVGGVFQSEGLNVGLAELAQTLGSVALLICKYFDFDDLFAEIRRLASEDDCSQEATPPES